jgi:signal recognition particle subunit SRP54|tara:strand:+ start:834 stop:2366 length:1533 start_codon:yes stop_codon:yes gene_type:complete
MPYPDTGNDGRYFFRGGVMIVHADAFGSLTDRLNNAWATLEDKDDLSSDNMKVPLKDIRRALLEADVSLPVVRRFIANVEKKAIGVQVTKGVSAGQQLTKVVADELCELMGGFGGDGLAFKEPPDGPTVILMTGLQGVGKTTACGKLALYLQKQGKRSLLVATDVYRPAAIDQLKMLGQQIGTPVFDMGSDVNPTEVAALGVQKAKAEGIDVVIVDTAGRLQIDEQLMAELQATKELTTADETLLVVDAMTGQEAAALTAAFDDAVGITGAVLTKMDGDTRGGAALSVREVSGKPIKFIGVGEKMESLEAFYPERMTSRILGMGDIVTLVERAQEAVKEEQAAQMREKIMSATFDFNDFITQMELMGQMGGMGGLMKMLPGTNGLNERDLQEAEKSVKVARSLIMSMTTKERQFPDILVAGATAESRRQRIVKGAGRSDKDLAQLIVMFGNMRVKMQKLSAKMTGASVDVGLTPQLSEADLNKLALEGVRKNVSPGMVRRQKFMKEARPY